MKKKLKNIIKILFQIILYLPIGGIYRYRKTGEQHQFQGNLIHVLQHAVGTGSYDHYKKYSKGIHDLSPISLRDLLEFKEKKDPININEVEPLSEILKRFGSGSMSHGALSAEAMRL